jgi:hypothetical protein
MPSGAIYVKILIIKHHNVISTHGIKTVYEQSLTQKPLTKITITVEGMSTMVEEAMVELVVKVEVEDDHIASTTRNMTTLV